MTREPSARERWFVHAERIGLLGIGVGTLLMLLLAAGGVWLFVPELDEAWLLFGLQSFVLGAPPPGMATPLVVTSAGLFAAIHIGIEWIAGNALWVHRLVSIACLGGFLAVAQRAGARAGGARAAGVLCAGAAAAAPGAVILGSQAFAEPIALLLLSAFSALWCSGMAPARRWSLGGALLGLALATRSAVLPMLPALVLFWLLYERKPAQLLHACAAIGVAIAVASACHFVYLALAPGPAPPLALVLDLIGASDDARPGAVAVLSHLALGTRLAPLGLALAGLAAALWVASRDGARVAALPLLLVCLGLAQLSGWALLSPKPLLRYAWPGLPLLWFGLGLLAAHAWAAASRAAAAPFFRTIVVALVLGSLASESIWAARAVSHGESTLIAAEYAGLLRLQPYWPFRAAREHAAAVRFLREHVGEDERVWVLHLPFVLAYSTGLDVAPRGPETARPEWLVLTPHIGLQTRLTPRFEAWLTRNCELRMRSGRYSIYRVTGSETLMHAGELTTSDSLHPL
jgi:hypothetical protein